MISNVLFEEVLEKDNYFAVHEKSIQKLAIEIFKADNTLLALLVNETFQFEASKQNLWSIMLTMKKMASNLYHISHTRSEISYR